MSLPGEPGYGMPSRGAAVDLRRDIDALRGQLGQLQTQLATVAASASSAAAAANSAATAANAAAAAATAAELSYSFVNNSQTSITYSTGWNDYAISGSPVTVPSGFTVMTYFIVATADVSFSSGGVIQSQVGIGLNTSSTSRVGPLIEGITFGGDSTGPMPIYSGTRSVTPGDNYYFACWAQPSVSGGLGAAYVNGLIIWAK